MSRRREAGFTLIELLVAITLLGLMMTMAFSGLRLGTRAWEAAEADDHEVYLVQQVLRAHMSAAFAPSGFGPGEPFADDERFFEGDPDQVSFIATLPDLFGVAGLYRVRVRLVEVADGSRNLVMTWRRWRPDEPRVQAADAAADGRNRRVLLEGVRDAAFSFFGVDDVIGERSRWRDAWQGRADLPVLVRLELSHPESQWPALIVAPLTDASGP